MPERRWRWVYIRGRHHLARETCQGKWVAVCQALQSFPFASTPAPINLANGGVAWALKSKVDEHNVYSVFHIRVRLDRGKEPVCSPCREHAKEIAGLWRGLKTPKKQERGAR